MFGSENYDAIDNRIRSYKSKKRYYTHFFHYFAKIKVLSSDSLTIEKRLTFYNVIILIRSVPN